MDSLDIILYVGQSSMMTDYSISLLNNIKTSFDFIADITHLCPDYMDSTRAMGGYWTGQFSLQGLPLAELEEWYNYYLGYRVIRKVAGQIKWDGFISQMRLVSGGQTYVRDLNTMVNRALVYYSDTTGATVTPTAWNTNALSIANYGQRDDTFTLDGVAANVATDFRDTQLTRYGWPRSVGTGGTLFPADDVPLPPTLYVQLSGYVFTLNWRFVVSNSATLTNLSSFMSTLIGESEFITAGTITANTRQVPQRFLSPMRTWDAIEKLTSIGDSAGNRYVAAVGSGRILNYGLAATTVSYNIANGKLYELDGSECIPGEIVPDRIARRQDAPSGFWEGDVYSDPRNIYLSEIQFHAPGQITLAPDQWSVNDELLALINYNRANRKKEIVEHFRGAK